MKEAITVLNGEMYGFYHKSKRAYYGKNILELDYTVEGLGVYENITHADMKNAVGKTIKIANNQPPSIKKQGKGIARRIELQKKFWTNDTLINGLKNLDKNAPLPQSKDNILTLVDNFDVPDLKKAEMKSSIINNLKNNTNIEYINDDKNI